MLILKYCNVYQCDVVILGPPGRPMGPLVVKDVTADSALLSWNKPEDNGGDDILGYVIEKLDTRTGEWEKVIVIELYLNRGVKPFGPIRRQDAKIGGCSLSISPITFVQGRGLNSESS